MYMVVESMDFDVVVVGNVKRNYRNEMKDFGWSAI